MIDYMWSISNRLTLKDFKGDIKMDEMHLGAVESKFADIIWDNEPIASGELVKICESRLNWKKSTTYTVLKKLCERGIFENKSGIVTSIICKKDFFSMQSEHFVRDTFNGSLPAFLAAFTSRNKLSEKEIDELIGLIEKSKE